MGVPEGQYLDYKEALTSGSEKELRDEFLKDVTSFANARGGMLLIGVRQPADNLSPDKQIVGLAGDVDGLRSKLESYLTSSIEPRVIGVSLRLIPLSDKRFVIGVWIPASYNRPHVVSTKKQFYVRHNEQSLHMSVLEIREAVITSINAAKDARSVLDAGRAALHGPAEPRLIVQAVPIGQLPDVWDTASTPFRKLLAGHEQPAGMQQRFVSPNLPSVTIDGAVAREGPSSRVWQLTARRDGYLELWWALPYIPDLRGYRITAESAKIVFSTFLDRLDKLNRHSDLAAPILIGAALFPAPSVRYVPHRDYGEDERDADRPELIWPELALQPGDAPSSKVQPLLISLANAFGLEHPI